MSFGIGSAFLIPRVVLLFVRQPFFDELFTRWIAGHSFAGIIQALHYDSGPPLYYFFVHLIGDPPLWVIRAMSFLFSAVTSRAMLASRRLAAAALFAVFPPAVLVAADARAYALCAMFVGLGVLALDRDRPYAAAMAFVAAAYSHYYGALFFPVLFVPSGDRLPVGRLKPALIFLLFAPGAWLALHQPRESMAWVGGFPQYPDVLFARPPIWLTLTAAVLLVLAAFRLNRYAAMTLIPLALALALRIYFPMRFESVIAVPLVLWLAASARRELIPLLFTVGLAICAIGIVEHMQRPMDDYREAALQLNDVRAPVVASGYLYLEAVSVLGERVIAFPPEQALHPGWRAIPQPGSMPPQGTFLWIGERFAPELDIIRRSHRISPIYVNRNAAIVKVN